MKICPACHQETFDGRRSCHRCGSDVTRAPSLEMPTADPATLAGRWPFGSKQGTLHLDLGGIRFAGLDGRELLTIPAQRIASVEPRGAAEMVVHFREGQEMRRVRVRVRWAPRVDGRSGWPHLDLMVAAQTWRPMVVTSRQRRRSLRDFEIVRDRWLSAIRMLLQADKYALGRASS